jgi:hypothetical protein
VVVGLDPNDLPGINWYSGRAPWSVRRNCCAALSVIDGRASTLPSVSPRSIRASRQ